MVEGGHLSHPALYVEFIPALLGGDFTPVFTELSVRRTFSPPCAWDGREA